MMSMLCLKLWGWQRAGQGVRLRALDKEEFSKIRVLTRPDDTLATRQAAILDQTWAQCRSYQTATKCVVQGLI